MSERHVIDDAAMNERRHVIEIDRIVLHAAPGARPERVAASIEAEIGRALADSASPARPIAHPEHGVAGEIARTVVRAIGTHPHGT